MRMAKKAISLVAVLVLAMSLVACGDSGIVGTWSMTEDGVTSSFTFEKDGTCKASAMGLEMSGTYKTDGDKLTITISLLGMESSQECTYKIDGNKLTITDEDNQTVTYTKK